MKKYKLTTDTKMRLGRKLFRIQALIDFGDVKKGDLGGYIEKEDNLSHDDNAWVCGDAQVYGNARVCDSADYLCFKGLGSCNRNTTFYKTKDNGISVVCGCFNGTLDEFIAKVKDTHGDGKYAKEYLAVVGVVKIHFNLEDHNEQ